MTPLIDEPNADYADKAWENRITIRLYDPPVDGKTPADGAGAPQSSAVVLRDREAKIAQGFTREVIGWGDEWPVLGDEPVRPQDMDYMGRKVALQANVEQAVVAEKKTRTRTIKR